MPDTQHIKIGQVLSEQFTINFRVGPGAAIVAQVVDRFGRELGGQDMTGVGGHVDEARTDLLSRLAASGWTG